MFTHLRTMRNKSFINTLPKAISSLVESYPIHCVRKILDQIPTNTQSPINLELKKEIILNSYLQAEQLAQKESRLAKIDASLPKEWSTEEKLAHATLLRRRYDPRAVITAHPTEVLSDASMKQVHQLVILMMSLKQYARGSEAAKSAEQKIKVLVQNICSSPMLCVTNLTPQEEIHRQNRYYLQMMACWPSFNERIITQFAAAQRVDKEEIRALLTDANKILFLIRSWVVADIDGNQKKSVQSMSIMLGSLQNAIIDFYLERIVALLPDVPRLKHTQAYLERCQMAIKEGIIFDVDSSKHTQTRFIAILNETISAYLFDDGIRAALLELRDLVDLIGFRGNLKQYVRQSSASNEAVFDNFAAILVTEPNIATLLTNEQGVRSYTQLSEEEKAQFHHYLRTDAKYFALLKSKSNELSAATIRELDILSFVTKHHDLFSYILSDTKNTLSLREVIILFGFTAFRDNQLMMNQIRSTPVNLIPLCETSADLARLPDIFTDVLNDPYLRTMLIKHGEFVYVPGPSDLGKESGEFAHVKLIQTESILEQILADYRKKDPRLIEVQLRPMHGSGNDSQRRISQSFSQLFATFQGADASRLAEYGAYAAYVENTAAQPAENTLRAREFQAPKISNPLAQRILNEVREQNEAAYKKYNEEPAAQQLFRDLTISTLGPWLNTSSRGESKLSTPKDIIKNRAIGLVNYEMMTRVHARRIMSADGLVDLSAEHRALLPLFYTELTVVRELMLKNITAIATSNIPYAWLTLQGQVPTNEQIKQWADEYQAGVVEKTSVHALAHLEVRSHLILQALTGFMPQSVQDASAIYFQKNPPLSRPSHILALEVLELMALAQPDLKHLLDEIRRDFRPRYKRLETCLDEYRNSTEPSALIIENAVLALRGDRRLMGGPDYISEMRSEDRVQFKLMQDSASLQSMRLV